MPDSAVGFGPADWLVFFAGALLVLTALLWTPAAHNTIARLAARTKAVMLLLFIAPIALRLLLLAHHPIPAPDLYDEFSHLLVADTLLHGRLANPPHPMHRFFETFFVLQEPTYSSIYPPGQGLLLAFGRVIAGTPWAGVLVAGGFFCAACFWMLRGYVSSLWALAGGALAVMEFGPLNLWTNSYWGGMAPAAAGCLVFGALPRLREAWKRGIPGRRRDALLLGAGFGAHLLTRPFETLFLSASALLFVVRPLVARSERPHAWRSIAWAAGAAIPALLLILLQNKQVTGRWMELPEALSQFQYGVPTTLTIEAPATPDRELTPQQELEYKSQLLMHGPGRDSLRRFFLRLEYRVRDYRFFFLPPLYVAGVAFLFTLRRKFYWLAAGSLLIFALGTNLFPYLLVHYLAGVTCLFVLASVAGLEQIGRLQVHGIAAGNEIVRVLLLLCGAQFALWYTLHLFEGSGAPPALLRFETWDAINHGNPARRIEVAHKLTAIPGKLLVFVHYGPRHVFQNEWVWNAADIDAARVVFARDRGEAEDAELMRYYPRRTPLLLDPDGERPTLEPMTQAAH